jgi:hypothetical protein
MKRYLLFILAVAVAFASCYKEEALKADLQEPKYVIEESSDPLDHARYEIYRNTGVYVLYDYTYADYKWNVSSISNYEMTLQEDRDVLSDGMAYLDKVFLSLYDDKFKGSYFPYKILLAGQIKHLIATSQQDIICAPGRSYLAIGRLRQDVIPATSEELKTARGEINGVFWGYRMYANGLVRIPDSFFEVTDAEVYGVNMENQADKESPAFLYGHGLWSYDELNGPSAYMAPDQTGDVADFVRMMTSHNEQEMKALMSSYPKLSQKYTILRNAIIAGTGVDLQQIGNME